MEETGQEIRRQQEQREAYSEQTQPGPIAVGCMHTTFRSDSCLGLMYNADVVTVVHMSAPIAVGCMNMTLRSDSCLGLMCNVDVVTIVHIVMEVQMFAKQSFQEEMMLDAVDTDIAVDSTAVIVHESAARRRKGEVTMEFLEAHDNLSDSPALEEPIESSLCRSSAAAGRVWGWWLQFAFAAERLVE